LYQTEPSGNYYSYKAIAIGARSQSAKTYLEKHYEGFNSCSKKELIKHALLALQGTTGDNVELNAKNTSLSVVSKDGYEVFDDESIEEWLELLKEDKMEEIVE
jgi:20S proteasome subunit alpha 6